MSDYTELKLAAEAASQGRWNQDGFDVQSDDINDYRVARCNRLADAKFIAAANPAAVLALIAETERLERLALDSVNAEYAGSMDLESICAERDQLRAENAGLKTGYEAYERLNAELKAENEALRNAAPPLDPVNGDQLPAINSKVLIHLSSCDAWVEHTVVGYYAWEDLGANEYLHRVFIRVRDADGCLNARLLKDVRAVAALGQGAQS